MQIIEKQDGDLRITEDKFRKLIPEEDADLAALELPDGPLLVSLGLWRARRDELLDRDVGVFVEAEERLDEIVDDLEHLSLIALDFPHFRDGRSYSKARLLRERYDFGGQIRAVGDVHHDQLFFMRRCGFDAFDLAEDFDLEEALQGFEKYSVNYQPAVDEEKPLFRRVRRSIPE